MESYFYFDILELDSCSHYMNQHSVERYAVYVKILLLLNLARFQCKSAGLTKLLCFLLIYFWVLDPVLHLRETNHLPLALRQNNNGVWQSLPTRDDDDAVCGGSENFICVRRHRDKCVMLLSCLVRRQAGRRVSLQPINSCTMKAY